MTDAHEGERLPGPGQHRADAVASRHEQDTRTVTAAAGGSAAAVSSVLPGLPGQLVRRGPGVPVMREQPARAAPTADDVWRTGLAANAARRPDRAVISIAISVILIAASVAVICLRLTHAW